MLKCHYYSCASRAVLRAIFTCISMACLASACVTNPRCYDPQTSAAELRTIFIVQRGWHTGVAVRAADWPNREWALLDEFSSVEFVEFGWGDERFYRAEENTFSMALRAALWPTPSVIHVIGLSDIAPRPAQADHVVAVQVSGEGLRAMTEAIEEEFAGAHPARIGDQASWAPAPNRFYDAKRTFYFPKMCNWWVAKRLEEAGCPIQAWSVLTAGRVMREARGLSGPWRALEDQRKQADYD